MDRGNGIAGRVETITPEKATEALKKNDINRPMRTRTVSRFATDMVTGDWELNGEPIIFAEDGTLLDGQHRLRAVIAAEVPVQMLVVRGIPKEAFESLGQGRPRNLRDVLAIKGEENSDVLATAARLVAWWEAGYNAQVMGQGTGGQQNKRGPKPDPLSLVTNAALSEVVERFPQLRESSKFAHSNRLMFRHLAAPTVVAGIHCIQIMTAADKGPGQFWMDVAGQDIGSLPYGAPQIALRNCLLRNVNKGHGWRQRQMLLAAIVRAWNHHCEGNEVQTIRLQAGDMPEFYGTPRQDILDKIAA